MTTAAIEIGPHIRARSEFQETLLALDERVGTIELTWEYARHLGRDEWLALKDVAGRNEIPLHVNERPRRESDPAANAAHRLRDPTPE